MISKLYFIIPFIVLLMLFFCCVSTQETQQKIIDINGNPIITKFEDKNDFYVKENGEKIIAYVGVDFNGGKEALKEYLDSVYYTNPNYPHHSEFNVDEHFFILFDKDLNIEEVRIMYRIYDDNKRYYYDRIFVDALKNTTGMWHKTVEDKEWYTYLHQHRIN